MKIGKVGWSPDYEFVPDAFRKLVKGEITADVYVEDLKRRVERDKRRFGKASNQESERQ